MIWRCSYHVIFFYLTKDVFAKWRDSKITYNLNLTFLNILNFLFVFLLYNNMIRSPGRKFWSFRHSRARLPHLLSCPLAKMSFAEFPYIMVFTYAFIFLPSITKIKITSNYTHIHLFVKICYCIYLIDSLFGRIKTL
jgi:hypothetical protein